MPELPEVETIASDLNAALRGQTISVVRRLGVRSVITSSWPAFSRVMRGAKVRRIFRRAKMLVIETPAGLVVIHLKMTGQLIYISKNIKLAGGHPILSTGVDVPNKHSRLVFEFKGGGRLYFNDLRKFGWVRLMSAEQFAETERGVGIEPLGPDFSLAFFKNMLQSRGGTTIKAVLLDQKKLAGLGNIYVDEALFDSRIKPDRRVATLTPAEIKRLQAAIPKILRHSIAQRGTTFRNFTDADGLKGSYMSFLKVYGRQGKPCRRCGTILHKIRVAGRGTHFCPRCQV